MTLTSEKINELLNIDESYKASDVLYQKLMSVDKNSLFEEFLNIENDLSFDWFTDYFQEEHSDRKNKKQDFTPNKVVELTNNLLGQFTSNADICAGTGGLTIKRWTVNHDAEFYCQEFSDRALPFLLFNLAIRNVNAKVSHGDALTGRAKALYVLTKADKFSNIKKVDAIGITTVDTVIMNPPYSLAWEPNQDMLEEDRFKQFEVLAPKNKADYAFLLTGLDYLSNDGTMAIILPHGVLFRGSNEAKIRQKLIEFNLLDAVIGLPEKLFLNTDIPTVILIFKNNRQTKDILFIDASREFLKGKNKNVLTQDNVNKIIKTYHEWRNVDKYAHVATLDEIKNNDFNLNISRYVDTFEPEPVASLSEVVKELQGIDQEIEKAAQNLAVMMSELVASTPDEQAELDYFNQYWIKRYGMSKRIKKTEQLNLL